jgi:hypothetical protein
MGVIWVDSGRFAVAAGDYDTDAQTYITAVEAADGQSLETATKDAINTLVLALKANSIWTNAAQFLLYCGPRTLAGALVALKGATPTNGNGSAGSTQFASSNYNRKTGLGAASNTAKYINTNTAANAVSATSHALFAYGSIGYPGPTANASLMGTYNGSNTASLLCLDEWNYYGGTVAPPAAIGRAFRSGTVVGNDFPQTGSAGSTATVTSMVGSRTSATSATLYLDSNAGIENTASVTPTVGSSYNFLTHAISSGSSSIIAFSSTILQATGIFSTGLNATQAAALRSAFATYVSAIAAAF